MTLNSTLQRTLAWLAIAAFAVLALWQLAPVLTPFALAAVLAYALNPLVNWLDRVSTHRVPRMVIVIVVEVLFIIITLCILLLIVPILVKEVPMIRDQVPLLFDKLSTNLLPWLDQQFGLKLALDVTSLKAFALKYLNANFENTFAQLMSSLQLGGSVALAVVSNLVLIPLALFYLLADWDRFVKAVMELVPTKLRKSFDSFMDEADQVLGQYLRGQLLVMMILAIYYSIALKLFGLELALPIGIFTGLAICVPYVGFGIGLILATLAGLLQFASIKAIIMVAVVFGIGQVVEGFYLTPRLVGERIGLHPLAVIFALLAFGQVFGFVGVLIALPTSAVLLVAIRRLRHQYIGSKLYQG